MASRVSLFRVSQDQNQGVGPAAISLGAWDPIPSSCRLIPCGYKTEVPVSLWVVSREPLLVPTGYFQLCLYVQSQQWKNCIALDSFHVLNLWVFRPRFNGLT